MLQREISIEQALAKVESMIEPDTEKRESKNSSSKLSEKGKLFWYNFLTKL